MANAGDRKEGIYVSLDVLLDTRIATIAQFNQDLATKILASGQYHQRDMDEFEGMSASLFKELYKLRNVETLKLATITLGIDFLSKTTDELLKQAATTPFHDGVQVTINYYPYQLALNEQLEMKQCIQHWLGSQVEIKMVFLAPEDLSLAFCKNAYSIMMMYEYEHWMNIHAEEFKRIQLYDILLFVPAIYFNKRPTEDELKSLMRDAAHPMKAIEMIASPLIELRLLDIAIFSLPNVNK